MGSCATERGSRGGGLGDPVELFFDLVFVFALTKVTRFMGHGLNRHGVLCGMLLVALL